MTTVISKAPPGKLAALSDARQAYFQADFIRCLEICRDIQQQTLPIASEMALLSARAYLRLARPAEAQALITSTTYLHDLTLDGSLTAQMLLAASLARQGDPDQAIEILTSLRDRTQAAHISVRSEIAFTIALAYYAKRDVDSAESYLEQVDPQSDIIHARALELLGWCYTVRNDFARSVEFFRKTLLRLADCQAQDTAIQSNIISTLSIYASELLDDDLASFVCNQANRMEWVDGNSPHHEVALVDISFYYEFRGDTVTAYRSAAQGTMVAPTPAWEAYSWAVRSIIAHNAGEQITAKTYAYQALSLLGDRNNLDWFAGEERNALLSTADAIAPFDPETAIKIVAEYVGDEPVDPMYAIRDSCRETAYILYVKSSIAFFQSDIDVAIAQSRKSFELFRGIGFRRRATIAANLLLKMTDDAEARAYIRETTANTENFITRALADQPNDPVAALEHNPRIKALPPAQREVVLLMCAGKTNKEIADLRGVSEQSIKNMVTSRIFRAFGVSSRAALVSTLLGSPTSVQS